MPRRVLFVSHDCGGTIPPMLALAGALRARGCEVVVLSQPSVAARATALGCSFTAFSELGDYDRTRTLEDQFELILPAMVGPSVGRDVLEVAGVNPVDVVVVDANLTGALAAAELVEAPSVVLLHSMYKTYVDVWFGELWPFLEAMVNETRASFALDPVDGWPSMFARHAVALSVVSSAFDAPVDAPLGNLRHCGFLVPPAPAEPAPIALPRGDKPLGLLSLSTTYQEQQRHLDEIIEAAARHVRLIVTTAGYEPIEAHGDGVMITEYLPHSAVLPAVDVVITHAGLGTVAAALSYGVPLVCHPFSRDQHLNAQRVEDVGAGISVTSADALAAAVGRIVAESRFRVGAREHAALGASEGGPAAAAELLISLPGASTGA